jgi:hypothetical protein
MSAPIEEIWISEVAKIEAAGLSEALREFLPAYRLRPHPEAEPIIRASGLESVRHPLWGFGWAKPEADGTYTLNRETGQAAAIIPVSDGESIVDLVAVSLATRRSRTRYGLAYILGFNEIALARIEGRPVRILRDPLEWLLSGGAGVVVLSWNEEIRHELSDAAGIICRTDDFARTVDTALRVPINVPPIFVPQEGYRAAV